MKKIKEWKSFESSQIKEEFDYDYVRQCFIDLIESGKIKYSDDDFVAIEYIKFATPDVLGLGSQPGTKIKSLDKIEMYIKEIEETKEVMLDIQTGIERVLEEHPEYRCDIFFDNGLEYGELLHTPTVKVSIWNTHH